MSFVAVGAGIGAASGIYGIAKGIGQQHAANQINPQWHQYTASPYAKQQLGIAQQLFNGRMAGAENEERNINGAQANLTANAQRNASSGAQALQIAGAGKGQADAAYNQLGTQEAQNKYNMLGNINQAYQANTNELEKVNQSQNQKYQMDLNRQAMLAGAGAQNINNGLQTIGQAGILYGAMNGMNGSSSTSDNMNTITQSLPHGFDSIMRTPATQVTQQNNIGTPQYLNGNIPGSLWFTGPQNY